MVLVRSLAIFATVVLLMGCGSRILREPVVTLESVNLAGMGLRGGTLMVTVQVENPNRFALSADRVRYQLAIADLRVREDTIWTDLASGTYQERFSVAAGDIATVQVPVEFTYAGLGNAASALLRAGTFDYRATGAVDVSTPLGAVQVPFHRGGMVTLVGPRWATISRRVRPGRGPGSLLAVGRFRRSPDGVPPSDTLQR